MVCHELPEKGSTTVYYRGSKEKEFMEIWESFAASWHFSCGNQLRMHSLLIISISIAAMMLKLPIYTAYFRLLLYTSSLNRDLVLLL